MKKPCNSKVWSIVWRIAELAYIRMQVGFTKLTKHNLYFKHLLRYRQVLFLCHFFKRVMWYLSYFSRVCCKINFFKKRPNNLAAETPIYSWFLQLFLTFSKSEFYKIAFCNSPFASPHVTFIFLIYALNHVHSSPLSSSLPTALFAFRISQVISCWITPA